MPSPSRFPSKYRIAQFSLDAIVAAVSLYIAFVIRFEGQIPGEYWPLIKVVLFLGIPCRLLIQGAFKVYSQIWRLFSQRDFWAIFQANSFYSLLLVFVTRLLLPKFIVLPVLPLGVAVMDWSLCLAGLSFMRFLRSWQAPRFRIRPRRGTRRSRRLLLVGAGRAGAQIIREAQQSEQFDFHIVGFLDDDVSKLNRQVEGIKVLGKVSQLGHWARRLQADEILITIPSAPGDRLQQIVDLAKSENLPIKILPPVQELLLDRSLAGQIREIRLEDLLGRPEIFLDFDEVLSDQFPSATAQIQGHIVLVTGAGGTIGAELCRQIAQLQPKQLILLGRGENSIFHIDHELRQQFRHLSLIPVIADVRDQDRMQHILKRYFPDVIFHAAAHKHVPLMEQNPTEAIENNALGSAHLAKLADKAGVSTFVLISTDKAVAPNNFMGMSKRFAEILVSAIAQDSQTRFLAVRFGNVLGSRGSVIPIFERQIETGGPVTITDPTMTRYFMTTPEAVRLVIQSLAVGQSGQTLVLDMGEPMKIYDLAEQLIRLKGYVPGEDIAISITGIRPGEKLHESLVDSNETLAPTPHPKILSLHPHKAANHDPGDILKTIQAALRRPSHSELWDTLSQLLSDLKQ